jgi:hypothetical protein
MQPSWLPDEAQRRQYRSYVDLAFGLGMGLSLGLMFGSAFGLIVGQAFGPSAGLIFGPIVGLISGLFAGLDSRSTGKLVGLMKDSIIMVDRLKWSWGKARSNLPRVLLGCLIFGMSVGPFLGPGAGLGVGLFFGLFGGLMNGLTSEQVEEITYPEQHLKQTRTNALLFTLIMMLSFGLIIGPLFGVVIGPLALLLGLSMEAPDGLLLGLIGLLIGLFFGLGVGLSGGSRYELSKGQLGRLLSKMGMKNLDRTIGFLPIMQHYSLRRVLAKNHLLPRQLIPFLDHCVRLIFLRRAGGSYIFVHRLLMEHFAEMKE